MLVELGLNETAEAVYRVMLAHPQHGVHAIAQSLNLEEEQVRRALDTLSELTLVRASYESQGGLRAVPPALGMEVLMARQQADLAARQQRLEASREAAARLIADYAALTPAASVPGVEQLIGLDRIRDRLATLTREVREELLGLNTDGAQTAEAMEASRPLDQELLDRGVRMRTVYLDSVRNDEPTLTYADWLTTRGAQVRTVPMLPTRMIVVDRRTAIIPLTTRDTAAGAVVLTSDGLVTALCALFETIWATARPLGSGSVPDEHGLTAQQGATLRLLASGHTDEAIAKRLGVSSRTARRIATDLMDRLGARSRFEAGVRAVQQGWLARRG
ncbi:MULTISPECIES: LuxR C-terminal-related transcriptional regulator [unclassified Streptomyces]|uniref:LuxR C-terminal-related transcriptional regulator n=1 Tax=unclassified Streptomyces TaxID=2593676 RepID=UPI0033260C4D